MAAQVLHAVLREMEPVVSRLHRHAGRNWRQSARITGQRLVPLAVALAVIGIATLAPGRLYPFTSTAMWLYLPLILLVTLRWGAGFGILTSVLVAAVTPTLLAHRSDVLILNDHFERVLLPFAAAGMLGTVLAVADLNRRRLAGERSSRQKMAVLLKTVDRLNAAADPEDVLLQLVQTVAELFGVHRAAIYTHEDHWAVGRYDCADGVWARINTRLSVDASVAGWVIHNGRPYRANGRRGRPADLPPDAPDLSDRMLVVPILARAGKVRGVLSLTQRHDDRPFGEDDQVLAEAIAQHAAIALERAQLMQDLHRSREELAHQVFSDPLTGLPNRAFFLDRLDQCVSRRFLSGHHVAVLFLDLDGFKLVNDSLGHAAGDELLCAVGQRLMAERRRRDTIARLGGDEFALLLEEVERPADAMAAAERVLASLRRPFELRGRQVSVGGSIGVALNDEPAMLKRPEDLLRAADIALYRAKALGKAQAALFSPSMSDAALDRLDLESDLRKALEHDELRLDYQPILDLRTGELVGVEALLRWQHPRRGLLEPDIFIPLAEEVGLIVPIGQWVLLEACRQAQAWRREAGDRGLRVSVNLSARQLAKPDLLTDVAMALRQADLDPKALELEITETTLMEHAGSAEATLAGLKQLGVGLAIDDFGTGYSSLSYLERLAVDRLKIDRSFLQALKRGPSAAAIVQAIIALARELHIEVVAEGIETREQLEFLRAAGCQYGQGFYLGRPLPGPATNQALMERAVGTWMPASTKLSA